MRPVWFSPSPSFSYSRYSLQTQFQASLNETTLTASARERGRASEVLKDFGNFNKTLIIIDTQVQLQNEAFAQIRHRTVSVCVCMQRPRLEQRTAAAVPTHNPAT